MIHKLTAVQYNAIQYRRFAKQHNIYEATFSFDSTSVSSSKTIWWLKFLRNEEWVIFLVFILKLHFTSKQFEDVFMCTNYLIKKIIIGLFDKENNIVAGNCWFNGLHFDVIYGFVVLDWKKLILNGKMIASDQLC